MKPRIFVSAVSKELRSARQIIANTLMALGYEPIWQDIFNVSSSDVRPMLRDKIDSCSAVIQIIGDAYGAEPSTPEATFGRVSYTQYEALYAQAKGKHVYYLLAQDNSPRDMDPRSVDQPIEDSDAARADADERRALQRRYRESILATEHIYYAVQSHTETELTIRRLKDELNRLRRGLRSWMIGVTAGLVFIAATVTWIMLGLPGLKQSIKDAENRTATAIKELSSPAVLADRIRKEIQAAAEQKISALTQAEGGAKAIAQIETERDLAIGRVDDLVKLIQETLKDGASEVFERAASILEKEGTDQALEYLESRRESVLTTARGHIERASRAEAQVQVEKELRNKSLEAIFLEADILESRLKWDESLGLHTQVVELAPDWFKAHRRLGNLYKSLGRYFESETHFREAFKLFTSPAEETEILRELSILLKDTNRVVASELLTRRALLIDQKINGSEGRLTAADLNLLAMFLQMTGRKADADPLFRRALAIHEMSTEKEDRLAASAVLGNFSNSLFQSNQARQAELFLRRVLAIEEEVENAGTQQAAICLNNLSQVLSATNRYAEAELVAQHALKIGLRNYGETNSSVANGLNTLGRCLQQVGRLEEAEMFLRRATINEEALSGTDNVSLAFSLNNLARLLIELQQFEKAEPLMRRSVVILRLFEINSGLTHPYSQNGVDFYRGVLVSLKYPPEKIEELIKSANEPKGPLESIVPEMEKALGPTKTVTELMSALDERYKAEKKPDIYFLPPDKSISGLLQEFLKPTASQLANDGWRASNERRFADAVVNFDEALGLIAADEPNKLLPTIIRYNRAIAVRELGGFEQASAEFQKTIQELEQNPLATPLAKGSAHYYRAQSEWCLGNIESAKAETEASLTAFGDDPKLKQSKQAAEALLEDLKANKTPPAPPPGDIEAQLDASRAQARYVAELAALSTKDPVSPVLDKFLGPALPVQDVLSKLDEQYRKEGKPEFWFLPPDKPLAPHLDEIIGPIPVRDATTAADSKL